jgi:hypothetical protein
MSTGISALYSEFTAALTEVLAENAVGPARRGRLARARAAIKKHQDGQVSLDDARANIPFYRATP